MKRGHHNRIQKVSLSLTPQQAVLNWLDEAKRFKSMEEEGTWLASKQNMDQVHKRWRQAVENVRVSLRGKPKEQIHKAVRNAEETICLLLSLHCITNMRIWQESSETYLKLTLFSSQLHGLMVEERLQSTLDKAEQYIRDRQERESFVVALTKSMQPLDNYDDRLQIWRGRMVVLAKYLYATKAAVEWVENRFFSQQSILYEETLSDLTQRIRFAEFLIDSFNSCIVKDYELEPEELEASLFISVEALQGESLQKVPAILESIMIDAKTQTYEQLGNSNAAMALCREKLLEKP